MQLTNIILKPYLTEKTYTKRSDTTKKYAFLVAPKTNKKTIALTFESIFNIKPLKIMTMIRKPTTTKLGTKYPGKTKIIKIAYICLPKGKDIAITKEEAQEKIVKQPQKPTINKKAKEINVNEFSAKEKRHNEKQEKSIKIENIEEKK